MLQIKGLGHLQAPFLPVLPVSIFPDTMSCNAHRRAADRVSVSEQEHRVDPPTCTNENGPDCRCVYILGGRKMTDQTVRRKLESFSSLETFSVVAILLILVMIAVPFPCASKNQWLPAARPALGLGNAAAEARGSDTLTGTSGEKRGAAGRTSQGSPFEVRTVVQREFCADMPGVVRFRSSGRSCKNGTLITNLQRHREEPRP